MPRIDVHQHIWSAEFIDALRARNAPPRLAGWTLHLDGEPPYDVDPEAHDLRRRADLARTDGLDRALISLSSPLGVEWLPPAAAAPLLDAYHEGARALPEPFQAWASACVSEIDAVATARDLDRDPGFAGLQLPATALMDAAGFERCAPLLTLLEQRGLPLFVHPGVAAATGAKDPAWWPALVPYVQQMHAAWYAFRAYGRPRHPRLRICFALLAGLAPLHVERLAARGGGPGEIDPGAFVETSSYGSFAIGAVVRAIGVGVVVYGSDRPYADPANLRMNEDAEHALRVANPHRLLGAGFQ